MECRIGCGACCIEASIAQAIPGMPGGKPGGLRCVNLDEKNRCIIWGRPDYPSACANFTPSLEFCGSTNEEAARLLAEAEEATNPER
ncbi:MAG: YkgJ family cysteine cluster protein [Spirochaetales bacterium]|nr:YkgJ family cysteine cluster protein [Spirochaetales bacterium]